MKVSNRKCINQLSKKSLKSAKVRNLIAVLAIALTTVLFTALLTIVASLNNSFQQQNFRMVGGDMHGGFKDLTAEQVEELRSDPMIRESGARQFLGMPMEDPFLKSHVEVSYMEPQLAPHYFCVPTEGSLPKEGTNEAATDTRVLELLGVEPEIGTEFTLTYHIGSGSKKAVTETFVLSGYWEYDEAIVANNVLVPKSYVEEVLKDYQPESDSDSTGSYSLDVMLPNSLHIEEDIKTILSNHGYQNDDPAGENYIKTGVNWGYSGAQFSQNVDPMTVVAIIALILLIAFTGYLIIYNVFQISVTNDIRFYGLLKTIGTTGKQLKKIVSYQAIALSVVGIPIGLVFGFLIGSVLTPVIMENMSFKTTYMSFNPLIFIGAAIFSLITVLISCRKPGKMAAKVSPIEAVRYTEGGNQVKSKKKNNKKKSAKKGSSLFSMARANLGRSRGKTVLVILSLSLAVVLMNLTVTFSSGFDMDKYLSDKLVSDFIFGHAEYFNTAGGGFRSVDQEISEEAIQEINAQGGIKESGRIYGQTGMIDVFMPEDFYRQGKAQWYSQENIDAALKLIDRNEQGYVEDDARLYGMEEFPLSCLRVLDGDLSKLSQPNYIAAVYDVNDYDEVHENSSWLKVGDKVTIRYVEKFASYDIMTGKEVSQDQTTANGYITKPTKYRDVTYEVAATVVVPHNESYRYYGDVQFVLGADTFCKDSGTNSIMSYLFNMQDEESDSNMLKFMEDYTTQIQTSYDYESKQDYVAEFEGFRSMFLTMGGVLSFIVGIVGVLNFINAVLTGIITRKREFAVLQAIGMTGKQLKQMLMYEGVMYTVGAVILSLLLNIVMGPVLKQVLGSMFWFFTYHFTVLPILIVAPIFIALGVGIPLVTYRVIAKHTIVERLHDTE